MDFAFTEEQSLLKDSVDRLSADRYGISSARNALAKEPGGWSRAVWKDFVDLGLSLAARSRRAWAASAAARWRP